MTKFIVVLGGVLSGVGKGIVTSSIGRLLKSRGYSVTALKIDPYLNVDAGTMRPSEHGEVWVTKDGGEIDQDLGNYERFIGTELSKDNNLTTGKIYQAVIEKERRGDYLGKTVRPIPHLVDEVTARITKASEGFDFCLVEVGGSAGDLEGSIYFEAVRRMRYLHKLPVAFAMVGYVPVLKTVGEQKTKPLQHAVASLRSLGISPDFLFPRSEKPLDDARKHTLVEQCSVELEKIFDSPDVETVYEVPLLLEEQGLGAKIEDFFRLPSRKPDLTEWNAFVDRVKNSKPEVKIAVVGKYVGGEANSSHEDVYISVKEALVHAAAFNNVRVNVTQVPSEDLRVESLTGFDGVLVPGGFGSTGVEGKIKAVRYCRENNVPFLGICYGMQMAVIEFARHECGLEGAHTIEVDPETRYPVIDLLPEQEGVKGLGGTMRLGDYDAVLEENTKICGFYEGTGRLNDGVVIERHRHRYEVNPEFIPLLEEKGLKVSGYHKREDGQELAEFIELADHEFFIGTQAHPEFKSRPNHPAPLYKEFIKSAMK